MGGPLDSNMGKSGSEHLQKRQVSRDKLALQQPALGVANSILPVPAHTYET